MTEHQERERLPTREQIEVITDMEALRNLEEAIVTQVARIEADLEFRSDGDLDWERRARAALAAHRATLTTLRKHIHRRLKGVGPPAAEQIDRKKASQAQNRETQAIEAANVLERRRQAQVALGIEQQRLNRKLVERLSFLHAFHAAAHSILSAEDCQKLSSAAATMIQKSAAEILVPA